MSDRPQVSPLGDGAVTLTLGGQVAPALVHRVQALAAAIRAARLETVQDVVPGYAALTVYYDPLHTDHATLAARLLEVVAAAGETPPPVPGREHRIPVRYDGPDLDEVARRTGLTVAQVIERHSAPTYEALLLGFVPGFAYLGELDPALVLERRPEPRLRVLAGSVGIAGRQTAVYPLPTPGGWHLIGRTDVRFFDPAADPPALLAAGDRVRFVPVAP